MDTVYQLTATVDLCNDLKYYPRINFDGTLSCNNEIYTSVVQAWRPVHLYLHYVVWLWCGGHEHART